MSACPLEPVTAEAFRPYGHLLQAPETGRIDALDLLVNRRPHARLVVGMLRADVLGTTGTATVRRLERHLHSSQTFLPVQVGSYGVVVCLSDAEGNPDLATLRAFRVAGNQGIHYAPGVWHLGIRALEGPGEFAMLVYEAGEPADTEFHDIEPLTLALGPA